MGFLLAAILLLWENLSNDVFDAETGVDALGKPHSVVNLTGRRGRIAWLSSWRWCWMCIDGLVGWRARCRWLW